MLQLKETMIQSLAFCRPIQLCSFSHWSLSIACPIMWFVEWGKIVCEYERKSQKKRKLRRLNVNRKMQSIHCGVRQAYPYGVKSNTRSDYPPYTWASGKGLD